MKNYFNKILLLDKAKLKFSIIYLQKTLSYNNLNWLNLMSSRVSCRCPNCNYISYSSRNWSLHSHYWTSLSKKVLLQCLLAHIINGFRHQRPPEVQYTPDGQDVEFKEGVAPSRGKPQQRHYSTGPRNKKGKHVMQMCIIIKYTLK